MAKFEFYLTIGETKMINSIEELQENFDEVKILEFYKKNNTLCRWLEVREFSEYLEKVKAISSTDDDQIIKELAEIFEVELSNKTDFEKLLDKADKLYEKDLFEDMLDTLEKALILEPNNDEVLQKIESCKEEIMQTSNPRGIVPDKFKDNNNSKQKNYSGEEDNCVKYLKYDVFFNNNSMSSCIVITGINTEFFYDITNDVDYSKLNIPSEIKGFPVYRIGYNAFENCSMLIEITIPDSITSIMEGAFNGCISLKEITIPDGVTYIGKKAFDNCRSLKEITIPDGVTSIWEGTFNDCSSLKKITIPDSVTSIGVSAFDNCRSLEEITIPDSITSIGKKAFNGCRSLKEITIPDGVTSIGEWAFNGCRSLKEITIPDSVTSIGELVFCGYISLNSISAPKHLRKSLSNYKNIVTYRG